MRKKAVALTFRQVCLLAGICLLAAGARGDVLTLDSGESLSGSFSRIRTNTLVFRTSLDGQMMTPMDNVKTLSVQTPLYISMRDGRVFYGRLAVENGAQVVVPLDGAPAVEIAAADIEETLPIPTPPVGEDGSTEERLRLNVSPGVQWRSDSDAPVEPVLRFDAWGRVQDYEISGSGLVERADPDRFPAFLQARAEISRDLGGAVRPYLGLEFERDLDRALSRRAALNLGIYRSLTAESDHAWRVMAAISAEQERRHIERAFLSGQQYKSDTALGVRLGLRFYRIFLHGHSLSESLTFFSDFTEPGDFRARSETVYMLPVTNRLQLRLDLNIDYERASYFGRADRWSATVGAGFNMAF